MKYLSHPIFLIITILICSCQPINTTAQEDQTTATKLAHQLDEYFNALLELKQFNGVVLVEKEGEVILRKAYNLQNDPKNSLYVTTENQFDLRSISKLISKYAIQKMEATGKISREDTIDKYLKDFPNGNKITINHLLKNQSGLPREFTDEDNLDLLKLNPDQIVELIKKEKLEFEPGSATQYSNLGYQLVYFIIGKLNSKTFAQYVQDEIYNPLNMNSSWAHFYTDQNNLKKFALYHTEGDDGKIVNIEHHEKGSKKQAKLFSTLDDLNKLLDAFEQYPYNEEMVDANGIIGHSGGSEGIRTHLKTNIDKKYSFVFLANYDAIPFAEIIKSIGKIMEEQPYEIPKKLNRQAIKLDENQISKFIGTYDFKDANHITFEFKLEEGRLVAYQDGELRGPLYAENDSLFFWAKDDADSIEFQIDENGNYKAIMDMFGAPWVGTKIE